MRLCILLNQPCFLFALGGFLVKLIRQVARFFKGLFTYRNFSSNSSLCFLYCPVLFITTSRESRACFLAQLLVLVFKFCKFGFVYLARLSNLPKCFSNAICCLHERLVHLFTTSNRCI